MVAQLARDDDDPRSPRSGRGGEHAGDAAGSRKQHDQRGEPTNELAQQVREGDEDRFTELYERIAPAVYAWVHLRLGRAARVQLDPEDVVQEVWLRAAKAFSQFDPARGHFRGWIFQMTKYTLLETFRALATASSRAAAVGSASEVPSHSPGQSQPAVGARRVGRSGIDLSQVPDNVTSFTKRIAREEGLQRLLDDFASLPDAERELLAVCGLEGRPASEAALLLGLTHEAARKRWLRLRQRLSERPELAAFID